MGIHFKKVKDGFEQLDPPELAVNKLKEVFEKKFGIDRILNKSVETFKIGELEISVHCILQAGHFLVIHNGEISMISKEFGLNESEFFSKSFNELLNE